MKKVIFLLFSTCVSVSLFAQGNRDSLLYAAAYEYVKNDDVVKNHLIVPSVKLVHTSYGMVVRLWDNTDIDSLKIVTAEDLKNIYKKYNYVGVFAFYKALSEKGEEFDKKSLEHGEDTISYFFPPIMNSGKSNTLALSFSKIFKNELFVKLMEPCDEEGEEDEEKCTKYLYYFKFNPDITIQEVQSWIYP